jgi:hypothetical protein
MKRAVGIAGIVALALAVAVPAFAQAPNFSGTWVRDAAKSDPMGGRGGGGGGTPMDVTLSIKQEGNTLTVERTVGENTQTITYKLDGSESKNAGGRGGESTYKSKWEGSKLVTEITRMGRGGTPTTSTEAMSIMDGALVIETTSAGREGGTQTRKQVYNKK